MKIRRATIAAAVAATITGADVLAAQAGDSTTTPATSGRWSLLVPSGTLIPTGALRHTIERGNMTAAQIAFAVRPTLAITSTFGWARSRDISTAGAPKLDVFTYDVGVEARAPRWLVANSVAFTPFAGAGAGGRSYNHRRLDVDATHNLAAYLSAGGELRVRRVGLRLEARDYLAQLQPLGGAGASRTSNDVVVMVGLRLHTR